MGIVEELTRINAVEFPVVFEQRRQGDPPVMVAANGEDEHLLEWQ